MLEMLANVNLQKDLGVIAMRGRIVVIGNRGTIEINARAAMNKNAGDPRHGAVQRPPAQLAGIHAALVEGWQRHAASGDRPGAAARRRRRARTRR